MKRFFFFFFPAVSGHGSAPTLVGDEAVRISRLLYTPYGRMRLERNCPSSILSLPAQLASSFDFEAGLPSQYTRHSPCASSIHLVLCVQFLHAEITSMVHLVNVTLDDVSPLIEYSPPEAWTPGQTTDPLWQS